MIFPARELAAHHEAGHAVATVLAFRNAVWLPKPPPRLPVQFIEIYDDGGGNCESSNIYSSRWPCAVPRYRPLMEAQVTIHLAGGIAEWI